jgi:hypothetical protein
MAVDLDVRRSTAWKEIFSWLQVLKNYREELCVEGIWVKDLLAVEPPFLH